jgi:predicted  nucleic acid-binding Zn ribbon protein
MISAFSRSDPTFVGLAIAVDHERASEEYSVAWDALFGLNSLSFQPVHSGERKRIVVSEYSSLALVLFAIIWHIRH